MKQKNLIPWLLLCLLPLLSGCKDDPGDELIWDFNTRSVMLKVVNASDQNLLDENTPGGWKAEDVTATYKDRSFECAVVDDPQNEPYLGEWTRYLPGFLYGLRTSTITKDRILYFGDFSPTNNYLNTPITYHWPDGTSTVITFDFFIVWITKKNPQVVYKCYLDGKELPIEKGVITIQK